MKRKKLGPYVESEPEQPDHLLKGFGPSGLGGVIDLQKTLNDVHDLHMQKILQHQREYSRPRLGTKTPQNPSDSE